MVRKHAFDTKLNQDQLREAFEEWGGIPRTVFGVAMKPNKRQNLLESLTASSPAELFMQAYKTQIKPGSATSIHFHLVPGKRIPPNVADDDPTVEFLYPAYCWATSWIRSQCWEHMKMSYGEQSLLEFMANQSNHATARAYAFEPHVFRTLENGGLYGRMKLLSKTHPNPVSMRDQKLPAMRPRDFTDLNEVNNPFLQKGLIFVPKQKNHTSVDFYVPDYGLMVQVTVGKEHGVKWDGIQKAIDSKIFAPWETANAAPNGDKPKLRLVFLCDRLNYHGFRRQKFIGSKNVEYTAETMENKDKLVEQYAWELDVENQLALHLEVQQATARDQKLKAEAGKWGLIDLDPPPRPSAATRLSSDKSIVKSGLLDASSVVIGKRKR